MTRKSDLNKNYYKKNRTRLLAERAATREQQKKQKTFGMFLAELSDEKVKAQAAFLEHFTDYLNESIDETRLAKEYKAWAVDKLHLSDEGLKCLPNSLAAKKAFKAHLESL